MLARIGKPAQTNCVDGVRKAPRRRFSFMARKWMFERLEGKAFLPRSLERP
jgi:hypothetical protein